VRYFDDELFAFLTELKRHNDRAWFTKNKQRYEERVRDPFLDFIADAGPELRKISSKLVADPRPSGGSMFRIHRDVRFSKDKSPYKTYVGAHFQLGEKGEGGAPGYYFHLEPGRSLVGGGMWQPEPDALQGIRERISNRPAEWKKARQRLDDHGDELKRPPRGFDADDPMIEDIKRKSFTAGVRLTDAQVTSPSLMKTFVGACRDLAPLMKFLATATGAPW
jgi:uncharacterized protein (TIGR02453 family)